MRFSASEEVGPALSQSDVHKSDFSETSTMPDSPVKRDKPIYVAVQDHLLELINSPDYGPGDRIPSERVLAETLSINRMTVRKAIDKLVERNLLERNGTSGTRVPLIQSTRPIELGASLGITRIVRNACGDTRSKLLHFGEETASESVAKRLDVAPGANLIMFRRLRTVNDEAFSIETSYLPAARFGSLAAEDLIAGHALYGLLKSRYGVDACTREREIGVGTASAFEAHLLGLPTGAPTLMLRLVARDGDGAPIEYLHSVNHPEHVVFRNSTSAAQD